MTVVPDPGAPEEVDPGAPIWRYMSLDRYLSMLHTKALWFTRVDCFDDPWEGQVNDLALQAVNRMGMPPEVLRPIVEKLRVLIFVHCWTMHEHESIGLWSSFVGSQPGVVIRSTAGRLEEVVMGHDDLCGRDGYGPSEKQSPLPRGFTSSSATVGGPGMDLAKSWRRSWAQEETRRLSGVAKESDRSGVLAGSRPLSHLFPGATRPGGGPPGQ